MEHIKDDDAALINLSNMCDKYLFISTIQGNYEKYKAWEEKVGHVRNYRNGELEQKLMNNGFSILKRIQWGFPFYSPLVRKLQLLNPDAGTGEYSAATRLIASILNIICILNSSSKGDILVLVAPL